MTAQLLTPNITNDEIRDIASAAAKEAVREMMVMMGVDTSDPKSLIDMQKDFAQLRDWREAKETIRDKGLAAAVAVIVAGALGAMWLFIKGGH